MVENAAFDASLEEKKNRQKNAHNFQKPVQNYEE